MKTPPRYERDQSWHGPDVLAISTASLSKRLRLCVQMLFSAALATGLAFSPAPLRATSSAESGQSSDASLTMQRQRLAQMLQERIPAATAEATDRAAGDFLDHLRQISPIAADKFASGQMDEDELKSRIDVFLLDHPELTGRAGPATTETPRARVAELLKGEPSVGPNESDRLSAADRFLERLGELSGTARDSLVAGTMTDEELLSRVKVFAADLRADAAAVAVDPAVAPVSAIVESFTKANLGPSSERPFSICFKGEVDNNGTTREFVIFKKRARKIRIHIIEGGITVGILAFDGAAAWRQSAGQPAVPMVGSDADSIMSTARFDDPLVDYRELGTDVRLEAQQSKGQICLHIREKDNTEMVSTLDSSDYKELSLRTRRSDGTWDETRFRDYRKIGTLNVPYLQEEWKNGALYSTTRIKEVVVDAGLLDQFFSIPTGPYMGFMDYMAVLAKVQLMETNNKRPGSQSPGGNQ